MTLQDSSRPTERQRPRFQFSLRGLMLLVLGVAVGLGWAKISESYGEAILAACTVWIVPGLMAQVRDLWRTFHGRAGLTRDQRWGWRFAIFWRLGVPCLLIGYYAVNLLLHHELIELPNREESFGEGWQLREGLLYLSLVIVLSSTPRLTAKRKQRRFSYVLDLVAAIGGALLCLLAVLDWMVIAFLVHVACKAIDFAHSVRFSSIEVYSEARAQEFFGWSILAAGFVLANLAILRQFTREWRRSLKRRLIWTGLLVLSLALAGVYPIWMATGGLRSVSPMLAGAQEIGPLNRWFFVALLIFVFATAATYRLVQSKETPAARAELNWRQSDRSYYHERRGLMVVVAIGILVRYLAGVGYWYLVYWGWGPSFAALAVLLLAGYGAMARSGVAGTVSPPELPMPMFLATWPAVLLLTVFGVCTFHSLAFAFLLSPWYLLSWP